MAAKKEDTWKPWDQDDPDDYKWRIVLVGKTGVGKSAAGNTLLGREAFESVLSPSSTTTDCQKVSGLVNGQRVAVIDTPGLFDTHYSREEVLKRITLCICLAAPGPHCFLVVIQLGRFTEEEQETVKMIQTTFGEEAAKFTMVLFTNGDRLRNQTIEEFIDKNKKLSAFVQQCGERYHVFNNEVKDDTQRWQLLDKIDKMAMANGSAFYTNDMFMRAEEAIEKEKKRLLKESEAERQREIEELRAKCTELDLKMKEEAAHQQYEREKEKERVERLEEERQSEIKELRAKCTELDLKMKEVVVRRCYEREARAGAEVGNLLLNVGVGIGLLSVSKACRIQ